MISGFISNTLEAIQKFLNGVSNTIWGLIIIFICMRMIAKGINIEAAYYFAGVGSTMIGIKASQPTPGVIAPLGNIGTVNTTSTTTNTSSAPEKV